MIDSQLTLENDQILLRPISEQDIPSLKLLCSDPKMWYWFTFDLSTDGGFSNWVQPAISGQRHQFVVIEKSTGNICGSTAFGSYSPRDERIEIGWTWLGKEFQGTGINQQMKKLMLEYCFESLNLKRVEIKTDVLNLPARYALLKLGATEEGVLRSHTLMVNGRRRDTIYYSVLPEEWQKIKSKNSGNSI